MEGSRNNSSRTNVDDCARIQTLILDCNFWLEIQFVLRKPEVSFSSFDFSDHSAINYEGAVCTFFDCTSRLQNNESNRLPSRITDKLTSWLFLISLVPVPGFFSEQISNLRCGPIVHRSSQSSTYYGDSSMWILPRYYPGNGLAI